MRDRPKHLRIVIDTEGWAYARHAQALRKYAPPDWRVTYGTEVGDEDSDVILLLNFTALPETLAALDRARERPSLVGTINAGWPRRRERLDPLLQVCDAVLFCNRDYYVKAGALPRTHWIEHGVDREIFLPDAVSRVPAPRVLWIGSRNHAREKGWFDIAEPLQQHLLGKGIGFDFQLVDSLDPPYSPGQMPAWYRSGTIFIVSSLSEGLPTTALEAASCGLVLIGTRVGVLPDLVENDVQGILVGDRSVTAFAEAVDHVIANQERMRRAMLETIVAWDWRARAKGHFAFFDRVRQH